MKFTNHHISDLVVRFKNAVGRNHEELLLPNIKIIKAVLSVMLEEGYIQSFDVKKDHIVVGLKYLKKDSVIKDIRVLSKPSSRLYSSSRDIPTFYNGFGVVLLSTPRGIVTDAKARDLGVGGELLFQVF